MIAGTAGASFLAYLLVPPIWSTISYNLRGYKGEFIVFCYKVASSKCRSLEDGEFWVLLISSSFVLYKFMSHQATLVKWI